MFKKKINDMTIGDSIVYTLVMTLVCFIPWGIISLIEYWEEVKTWFKKKFKK